MPAPRALIAALFFVIVAGACSGDGATGGREEATETTVAEEPVRGGTLVVAISSDPGALNPAITTSGATHTAAEPMFNGLLDRDKAGEPLPDLATKWNIEENGAVYRFTLRDGVTWHDGKPFTSADVKFTFDEMLLKFHARTKASMGPALAAIETPDPATVVFRFKQPYAPLLQQLDVTEAPILPKHLYEGTDPQTNPANSAPVGTGAFKFVSYAKGSEVRMARNPDYFKPELPYLDEMVMRVIPEPATQVLGLENGEIDYVGGIPGADQARLRADDRITLEQTGFNPGGSNCVMTVSFNLDRPILKSKEVRTAFAHAIDRKPIVDNILFGEGAVATAPISSEIAWAHGKVKLPEFDVAKARQLLDGAGWKAGSGGGTRVATGVEGVPDGTPLTLDFLHFPTFAKYGELLRQQLAGVGIDLSLKPLEPAVFAPTVFAQRSFDTNVISYCQGTDPEIGFRRTLDSAQISSAPFTNAAAYRNPEVDKLFTTASQSVERRDRTTAYQKIQEAAVSDLPYLWLVETRSTRGWQANCQGFRPWTGSFAEAAFCKR
ncbi:MAG: ABC transporter substrate-binding protein [Actinobacteria bacterium]|nr:ABC transporter substrate-binding protein [Actinomycetota bacterium]